MLAALEDDNTNALACRGRLFALRLSSFAGIDYLSSLRNHNTMSDTLHLALLQLDLHWHSPDANRAHIEEHLRQLEEVDIVLLPEMFTTGFTMEAAAYAEPMNFHTCRWMRLMAAHSGAVIAGSIIVKENGHYYNRLLWVTPEGDVQYYDKRHLFRMAGEHKVYTPGSHLPVFQYKGWRIAPFICYDLRFPVWSYNRALMYDLAIYVANWPAPRITAWDALLAARAIENVAYVAGVNRTGTDPEGMVYPGHSAVFDFKGQPLAQAGNTEETLCVKLDKQALQRFREKFPVHLDADDFLIVDGVAQNKT